MARASWFGVVCVIAGCSGPWGDLAQRYSADEDGSLGAQGGTISLVGPNYKGRFSIRNLATFTIDDSGLYMAVKKPASYLYPPLKIPPSAVTACSRLTGAQGFDTPLWIGDAKVEIVLDKYEVETLAWCHEHRIPVVPREVELAWIFGQGDAG